MKKFPVFSLKKIPFWLILSLVLITVLFVIYHSRQIFFFQYEPEYYENLYYHSQWNIPGSNRGISDGSLYKFVGYRLVEGENPFYLNFEAPPFGKYLYGLSEYFTGNPYWVSLFLYITSLVTMYYFAKLLFKETKYALLVLLLFTVTPFVATQVRDTMLDLPLTTFFLLQTFFMARFLVKPNIKDIALSGIFLGLATGTKIGVYTPLIFLVGLPLVFWSSKKLVNLIIYPGSILIGYIISYTAYFLHHKNPIPFIKLHQKQIDFYLGPGGEVDHLNQWRGIFMNSYQGWWGIDKMTFGDWSPVLPLGVLAALIVLFLAFKRKQKEWIYISAVTLSFLIINSFISFYPRYLMPAVPGFILLIAYFTKKYWYLLLILAVLSLPFFYNSMVSKNYFSTADAIGSFVSKRMYRELYRSIEPEQRKTINEKEFISILENFYNKIDVRKIDVEVGDISQSKDRIEVNYNDKYKTGFGEIASNPVYEFRDVHNQTVLVWKWDYLWPKYSPNKTIIINEKYIPLQAIRRGGNVVATNAKGKLVYIITRHIEYPGTLDKLASVMDKKDNSTFWEIVRWSSPDDFPRYVGVLDENLDEGQKKAEEIKGVKIKEFNYLKPVPGAAKKDINELIRETFKKRPELFYTNADIYFDTDTGREYILKSNNNERVILDL